MLRTPETLLPAHREELSMKQVQLEVKPARGATGDVRLAMLARIDEQICPSKWAVFLVNGA